MGAALPPYFNPPVESLIKWIIDLLKRGEILMIVASEYVPVSVRVIGAQLAVDLSSLGLKVEFLNYDAPKVRQDIFRAEESAKALLSEQGTKHPLSFGCQPLGELHVVEYLPFYGLTDTASHIRENSKGADVIIINALPRMVGDIHVRKESLSWVRKKLGLAARASDVAIILLNHTRESLLEKPPTFRPEINHAKGMKHVTHTVDHALFIGNGDKRDKGPRYFSDPQADRHSLIYIDPELGRFRNLGAPGLFYQADGRKFVMTLTAIEAGFTSCADVASHIESLNCMKPFVLPELKTLEIKNENKLFAKRERISPW
ncbi:hypothetical protein PDESU_02664 [Pontiella desulfatans]|uniref:Uncharacterized protein n=2 Tax=Pontiella desulfatans TaxID=2750659 RepID=A0A6C2U2L0_PONDE|nr:hypothetical protein PDESU_02664 [Pontiella desulfatans]